MADLLSGGATSANRGSSQATLNPPAHTLLIAALHKVPPTALFLCGIFLAWTCAEPGNNCLRSACIIGSLRTYLLYPVLAVPVADTTPEDPPPYIVLVHGPPGTGKTTLIKCLVKHWTRQSISEVKGPITVVCNKQRRITLVECPQVGPKVPGRQLRAR